MSEMKIPAPPPWHRSLTTVGVTGTNGKTSTTTFVAAALSDGEAPVVRVTTVGAFVGDDELDVPRTLGGFLEAMRIGLERGARFAAIELTSEALARGFAHAWPCRVGVFTNLTRDHLDAHGSAEHYLASKAQLFMALPPGGTAVLNAADPASALLAEVLPEGVERWSYAAPTRGEGDADLRVTSVRTTWAGTRAQLAGELAELSVRAIGPHYVENALGALGAARALGVPLEIAASRVAAAAPPPGRFEVFGAGPRVVVDYAHTPDALARTIAAARELGVGAVVAVFGAGGERDQAKRPMMGAAAMAADRVVLTSDNPRGEDPAQIAEALRGGLLEHPAVTTVLDRRRALETALEEAGPDDVIVLAGKGHERSQEVAGEMRVLDDRDLAAELT